MTDETETIPVLLVWNDFEDLATFYWLPEAPKWLLECHDHLINGSMPDALVEKLCRYFYGEQGTEMPLQKQYTGKTFATGGVEGYHVVNTGIVP